MDRIRSSDLKQVLIMESFTGVKHVVTIQWANVVRKCVPRTHQGVRCILRPSPTNLVEGANHGGLCSVAGPCGNPILADAQAIVLFAIREGMERKRRHRCRLFFPELVPVQIRLIRYHVIDIVCESPLLGDRPVI